MNLLRISLFGTVRISHDNRPSELGPKAQALLAYLLLQGARLHPREKLLDLFWSDHDQSQARCCLRTTLWRLRRALEPEHIPTRTYLLITPADEIGFNWDSNHWLDVLAFERQVNPVLAQPVHTLNLAAIQILEDTLRLYTGDLLESFYDDWAIREQERLRCLYLNCLEHLMRYYQYHGDSEKSLAYGQQILMREPLHEEVHREVMRLYLAGGQRALAIRQYETCRDILAQELKIAPMAETQALHTQALIPTGQPHEPASVLIKRTQWQQALTQLSLAWRGLDEAQQQFDLARQRLDQAQQQLQRALKIVECSVER